MTTPAIQMKLSAREFNPRGEAIAAKVNELQAAGENRAQISLLNKSGAARVHNDKVAMNAKYMKKAENALRSIKVENAQANMKTHVSRQQQFVLAKKNKGTKELDKVADAVAKLLDDADDKHLQLEADMALGDGSYAKLFGVNVWGHLSCAGACAVGFAIDQWVLPRLGVAALTHPRTRRQPDVEHYLTGESVPRGGAGAGGGRTAKETELVKATTATVDVTMA